MNLAGSDVGLGILLALGRSRLSAWDSWALDEALERPFDADRLHRLAAEYGLMPLLYRHLVAKRPQALPADTEAAVRHEFKQHVISRWTMARRLRELLQVLRDDQLQLVDGGRARRVVTGIDDAIDAFLRILDRHEAAEGQIFNVGNPGNETTIRELAERMRQIFAEVVGDPRYLEHPLHDVAGADFYGPGYEDSDRRLPSIEKARTLLGWEPVVPLDSVLRETIAYYVRKYWPGERVAASHAHTLG